MDNGQTEPMFEAHRNLTGHFFAGEFLKALEAAELLANLLAAHEARTPRSKTFTYVQAPPAQPKAYSAYEIGCAVRDELNRFAPQVAALQREVHAQGEHVLQLAGKLDMFAEQSDVQCLGASAISSAARMVSAFAPLLQTSGGHNVTVKDCSQPGAVHYTAQTADGRTMPVTEVEPDDQLKEKATSLAVESAFAMKRGDVSKVSRARELEGPAIVNLAAYYLRRAALALDPAPAVKPDPFAAVADSGVTPYKPRAAGGPVPRWTGRALLVAAVIGAMAGVVLANLFWLGHAWQLY